MKEFKEYPIITNKECEDKKMYMIIDILDIFYKNYNKIYSIQEFRF